MLPKIKVYQGIRLTFGLILDARVKGEKVP
jgi:hypothetical protein